MAMSVDRLREKLRAFYDPLPVDEQQALEAILRQSQAGVGEGPFGFISRPWPPLA